MKLFIKCTVEFCTLCLLTIISLSLLITAVTAQKGPGAIIVHPGQDVELLCTVNVTSDAQAAAWLLNKDNNMRDVMGPYRLNSIRGGVLAGYRGAADPPSNNLIVENIMMNDDRNGNDYKCVIVPAQGNITLADIIAESVSTILLIAGVPDVVPNVAIIDSTINSNGNHVTLTLSWGEPFNNFDPIVNYTVSCSGDGTCPPNFTTTDTITRSYTITNLIPMTNYTFSVVAANSIGSGEAGVLMITTPPGTASSMGIIATVSTAISIVTTNTTSSIVSMSNVASIVSITITSSMNLSLTTSSMHMNITTSVFTASSTVGMSTITSDMGKALTTSHMDITTTTTTSGTDMNTTTSSMVISITTTSGMDMYSITSTEKMSATPSSATTGTDVIALTSNVSILSVTTTSGMDMHATEKMSATSSSVGIPTTTTMDMNATSSSVGITSTVIPSADNSTNDGGTDDSDSFSTIAITIIIIIFAMILLCCCSFYILFCCCCARKEWYYPNEKLCNEPRNSFGTLVILGVLTLGISILLWYIYLKCQSNEADKDKYCKITNVSIFVLGIYTCGTSVLLWWLYKGIAEICGTRKKHSFEGNQGAKTIPSNKPAIPLSSNELKALKVSKDKEVLSVTNQLASHHEVDKLTTNFQKPDNEQPASSFIINDDYEDEKPTPGYAVVDTKNVIAYNKVVANAQKSANQNQSIGHYAVPKETVDKSKEHEDMGVASARQKSILQENEGPYALVDVTTDKDQRITGAASARLGSLLYQNTGPYALPNVIADKDHDQEATGVINAQKRSSLYQNTGPYALPGETADKDKAQGKDQMATGVINAQQRSSLYQNTGPYALPGEIADKDKDQRTLGATNTQESSAQYQNVGSCVLPNETANNVKDQRTDQGAMGVANAQQSSAQDQNAEPFALSNKTDDKNKKTKYAELEELSSSGIIHTTANDTFTPYAEIC